MKIAFFTYPAAFQNIGGGEIQLLKTRQYLEKAGVEVRLFDIWNDRIEDFDLLHIFSSSKECLGLAQTAKERKVKVVVSPVLFTDLKRALREKGPLRNRLDLTLRHLVKVVCPAFPSSRRSLLLTADLLCPNSGMELNYVKRYFAIPPGKMQVVPNGVDADFAAADPELYRRKYGRDPFILSVSRVEPRKNHLNLIRAAKGLGVRVVFIGSPVSGQERYFEACRKEGDGFVQFIPHLDHEDPLLKSAYAACSLFVLPSFVESTGLVVLEAALAGAKAVVTRGGFTKEYYLDHVDYIDPADVGDIRAKIKKNLEGPEKDGLKNHVLAHYTWDKVAKRYISLYKRLLSRDTEKAEVLC